MELEVIRAARDLRRSLLEPLTSAERTLIEDEVLNAEEVIAELRRHRSHTPFFKVVARGAQDGEYLSVYDGSTHYALGSPSKKGGGCFVHQTAEEAERSG